MSPVRSRPILFSAPMIRALLDDRKTQTRRIVKPQPPGMVDVVYRPFPDQPNNWQGFGRDSLIHWYGKCPYGTPGDLLIVRETHWRWGCWRKDGLTAANHQRWRFKALDTHPVAYCLPDDKRFARTCYPGMDRETVGYWKRPSLFMPRAASRLTLEITDVRVERLQDISEADAVAEGIQQFGIEFGVPGLWQRPEGAHSARGAYAHLWNHINGPDSWVANPWVWAVSFRVHRANVDQLIGNRP